MLSITSTNSTYILAIAGVFPIGQKVEGFSADAAFAQDAVDMAETVMGVDGYMSAGYTPYITPQTITLMPNSPSFVIFNAWIMAQKTAREVFSANATILIPSIGKKYALTNGVLVNAKLIPDVKKVLQPVEYKLHWEDISPAFV